MRYYSEETVKALLENVSLHTLEDCPSIEIPDKHGDLVELQNVEDMICEESSSSDRDVSTEHILGLMKGIPVILETNI